MTERRMIDVDITDRADGKVPVWSTADATHVYEDPTAVGIQSAHGFVVRNSTTASVNGTYIGFDTDVYDSENYHFTSAAALTGTVTKAAASPLIVGSGTSFTTELAVNQVISIPGTAVEYGCVKAITDNTNLELWQTMANSAAGQTATRRNHAVGIPASRGGFYVFTGGTNVAALAAGEFCRIQRIAAGVAISTNEGGTAAVGSGYVTVHTIAFLAEGDIIGLLFTGNRTLGHASAFEAQSHFSGALIGS